MSCSILLRQYQYNNTTMYDISNLRGINALYRLAALNRRSDEQNEQHVLDAMMEIYNNVQPYTMDDLNRDMDQ